MIMAADSLTENFKELRLKTPEEIEKVVVDESLSPVERAIFLLCSGEDVQKLSVLFNLAELLVNHPDEVQRRILPKIRETISVCSMELHQAASRSCLDILQRNIISPDLFAKHFVPMIITGIDSRDVEVFVLWLDTILEIVDNLPNDIVVTQILPKAQNFSHSSQSVSAKMAACKLLGKIATRLPNVAQRKSQIMPYVKSLAQELEFDVRAAVSLQLSLLAQGLSQSEVRELILPELLELCSDEDFHVQTASLESVVALAPQLDNDAVRSQALPFILKFFRESFTGTSSALPAISSVIGRVCTAFLFYLSPEEKQLLLECFKRLCVIGQTVDTLNAKATTNSMSSAQPGKANALTAITKAPMPFTDAEARPIICRENAALNFPLMIKFCGLSRFKQDLKPCLSSLCSDQSSTVRRAIAGCFHEIVNLLEGEAHILTKELASLLDDNSLDVLDQINNNFSSIAAVLGRNSFRIPATTDSRPTNSVIVLNAMLSSDQTLSRTLRWRVHVSIIANFALLKTFCSPDVIASKIMPSLFNRLNVARQLPLKLSCIRTILVLTRCLDRYEKWLETFHRFREELLLSSNSYRRSLYIEVCHMVLELYSRGFFKVNCLELVLTLAQDPVPNLRIGLCELLLKVKPVIKLPADRSLLQALESAVRKLLLNETDHAVSAVVTKTVEKLDRIEVQLLPLGRSPLIVTEVDTRDKVLEEEERALQEVDDREKKEEETNKIKPEGKAQLSKQLSRQTLTIRDSVPSSGQTTPSAHGGSIRRVKTGKKTGATRDLASTSTSETVIRTTSPTKVGPRKTTFGAKPGALTSESVENEGRFRPTASKEMSDYYASFVEPDSDQPVIEPIKAPGRRISPSRSLSTDRRQSLPTVAFGSNLVPFRVTPVKPSVGGVKSRLNQSTPRASKGSTAVVPYYTPVVAVFTRNERDHSPTGAKASSKH